MTADDLPPMGPPESRPVSPFTAWLTILLLVTSALWASKWLWQVLFAPKPYQDPWIVWDDPNYDVRCYKHKDADNIVCVEVDPDAAALPPLTTATKEVRP